MQHVLDTVQWTEQQIIKILFVDSFEIRIKLLFFQFILCQLCTELYFFSFVFQDNQKKEIFVSVEIVFILRLNQFMSVQCTAIFGLEKCAR